MIYYKNLVPGQMQIGNIVMGRGTNIIVENVDVKPYDINAQDYQVAMTSEKRFGIDQFVPTTIEITAHVLHNRLLPGWEGYIPNFWHSMPRVSDLAREWRFDEGRTNWGQMKALYLRGRLDEIAKVVYGRPGQFSQSFDDGYNHGESVEVVAEFRRGDTLAYGVTENIIDLALNTDPVFLVRNEGDGPNTWFKLLLYGPLTHPVIMIGQQEIELDLTIEEGKAVEINSQPWQRRAVSSDRVNIANNLIGRTKHLDQLTLPYKVPIPVKWTAGEANMWVPVLGNESWEEDIDDYNYGILNITNKFNVSDKFTTIHGRVAVHIDIFNFGSNVFPWLTPRKFLGAALFSNSCAVIYNEKKFNTPYQYCEAQIVEPFLGKSGIVIMSNPDMTNFVVLIVENNVLGNHLRIASGTSYNNLTVQDSWLTFGPWKETDKVGIGYDPETQTYTAYLNGEETPCTWTDSTGIVNTGPDNRSQGFIFDLDGNLLTRGIGFAEILAYDRFLEPAQIGKVYLIWQDSYTSI